MKSIINSINKEMIECFLMIFTVFTLFFSVLVISGMVFGVNWEQYIPDFSWRMVNTKEMKDLLTL
ncbi:hypothetical protein LF817_18385 [Halobacillus sp. A1]|uniref:hypothetical protein n=1 Tax=Halobacillus sp. A1 TaxID=2880262 RepID=UPI0020A65CAD|nr:hypothetical protein [Halobacillus sp. A1]MCP3033298.1 hypothetical protein [Halobacillus sp. A1]